MTPFERYKARWAMYARLGQGHAPGAVRGPPYNGRGTRSASRGGTAAVSGPHSISEGQVQQLPQGGGHGQVGFHLGKAGGKFHFRPLPFFHLPLVGTTSFYQAGSPKDPRTGNLLLLPLLYGAPTLLRLPTPRFHASAVAKRKTYSQAHKDLKSSRFPSAMCTCQNFKGLPIATLLSTTLALCLRMATDYHCHAVCSCWSEDIS